MRVTEWPKRLQKLHALIRDGDMEAAAAEIEELRGIKVPRVHAATVAFMAGRVNLPAVGARVLHPIVRPSSRRGEVSPSDIEKAEYACCLAKLGAADEALSLLGTVDPKKTPVALLYKTFALASRWEYRQTIPLMQEYLKTPELTQYQRLVGMANLAAALVYERHYVKATPVLTGLIHDTSVRRYKLLLGIAFELSAANCIMRRDFALATRFLEEAEAVLRKADCLDQFFLRKWKAIASFLKTKKDCGLSEIIAEAQRRQHWETLRDIDRYKMIALGDPALYAHLHFGTPYPSFKARLLEDFGAGAALPAEYFWLPGKQGEPAVTLDVESGEVSQNHGEPLKRGQLLHRVLRALASDFYRPQRIAVLHHRLYPDEYFNPETSARRVHEAIRRFRVWCADGEIPLQVEEIQGGYRLTSAKPVALRFAREESAVVVKYAGPLETLRTAFGDTAFSLRAAADALGVSARSAHRVVSEGQEKGHLLRSGSGKATTYIFPTAGSTATAKPALKARRRAS